MKRESKLLTYEQARELKWFCQNVVGTRQEYYKVMDMANGFDRRLARLEKTCEAIEKYLGEEIKPIESPFFKETEGL